ncbi:MAG: hypothetical protein M3Y06_11050 [Actinomycetota bacterium]|nr:hypothetical protein [Actinomycetota bacterium]
MPDLGARLLSRLLPSAVAHAIAQQGALILTGYVTESADLLAAAFGVRDDPRYRDRNGAAYVLQFPYEGLMRLTTTNQRPRERRFPTASCRWATSSQSGGWS